MKMKMTVSRRIWSVQWPKNINAAILAKKLGVSRFVVAKWIQNGNLPDAYVEKVRAIRESEVIRED